MAEVGAAAHETGFAGRTEGPGGACNGMGGATVRARVQSGDATAGESVPGVLEQGGLRLDAPEKATDEPSTSNKHPQTPPGR